VSLYGEIEDYWKFVQGLRCKWKVGRFELQRRGKAVLLAYKTQTTGRMVLEVAIFARIRSTEVVIRGNRLYFSFLRGNNVIRVTLRTRRRILGHPFGMSQEGLFLKALWIINNN
jgi:hypothetical protein